MMLTSPRCPDCYSGDLRNTIHTNPGEVWCADCDTIWLDEDVEEEATISTKTLADPLRPELLPENQWKWVA